jgi:methylated-DNA-[protein]-cysteine S-methyltransferase
MKHTVFESPIGSLLISEDDHAITQITWLQSERVELDNSPLLERVCNELSVYFLCAESELMKSLPLAQQGTEFQNKVWQCIQTIPCGETRSYSDLAQVLDSSPRAVGNACRANPFVILTPCHRVISKSGLGGYDGATNGNNIIRKKWLLAHERSE